MKLEITGTVEGVQPSLLARDYVQLWMRVDYPRGDRLDGGPSAMLPIRASDGALFTAGGRVKITLELVEV